MAAAQGLAPDPQVPELLSSKFDKPLVAYHNFLWVHHKVSNNGMVQFWRCNNHSSGCKARARSAFGTVNLGLTKEHDHHSVEAEIEKRRKLLEIQRIAAAQREIPTKRLVEQAFQGLSAEATDAMPNSPALARLIQKKRLPEGGGSLNGRPEDVVWPRESAETIDGNRFLLVDSRNLPDHEPNTPVFFVFASPTGIRLLREISSWTIDGTFYSAPRYFSQLYTINAVSDTHSVPCVFFLLPDKTANTYKRAFRACFSHQELQGIVPTIIFADFEQSPPTVLRAIFADVVVQFCLFHLNQNCYRQVQLKGLQALYNDPEHYELRKLLRCLPALAFLPVNDVESGLEEVVAAINAADIPQRYIVNVFEYLEYFQRTYVYRLVAGQLIRNVTYPPQMWNVHDAVLNDRPRSNNPHEAWHAQWNANFARPNLPLAHFVTYARLEEASVRRKVSRAQIHGRQLYGRNRRPRYVKRDAAIKTLVRRYVDENLGVQPGAKLRLLRAIQFQLNKARIPAVAPAAAAGPDNAVAN